MTFAGPIERIFQRFLRTVNITEDIDELTIQNLNTVTYILVYIYHFLKYIRNILNNSKSTD